MARVNKLLREAGEILSKKELKQIARQTDLTPQSIVRRAKEADINIKPGAKNFARNFDGSYKDDGPSLNPPPGLTKEDVASIFETLQTGEENLTNLQGQWSEKTATIGANATVSAAGIRADADKEVAKAYADAQKYASTLGLEGVKYGADKESEWRQAVANIEVKGKLDLQPIINAGLEKVAGIEAQASRDVAETTGKYSLESMKQRTEADKSIGKMQLAGSMYGLLGSVFG
jgi:hypothetical protein